MNIKTLSAVMCAACLTSLHASAQLQPPTLNAPVMAVAPQAYALEVSRSSVMMDAGIDLISSPEKKDDPGYKKYKEGYNLILDEKWEEARKQFGEMVKQFPKSEYVDDAEYWSAYALKHIDKKKAKEAYKQFILNFPKSNFYDDAVADAGDLDMRVYVSTTKGGPKVTFVENGSSAHRLVGVPVPVPDAEPPEDPQDPQDPEKPHRKGGFAYTYDLSRPMQQNARALARLDRKLRISARSLGSTFSAPSLAPGHWAPEEKLDPQTQLKMEALYALGDAKEDSLSFATLREVVTNPKQPLPVREAAMDVLSGFRKYDVLNVFLEVAKKDTSEEVQNMSIDYIGQISSDKNKSVAALIDLFSAIPQYRVEKLQTVLWSIAEIGNQRSVAFLGKVAKTHDNYVVRSEAIHCLGNIGGSEAREALYDILKEK